MPMPDAIMRVSHPQPVLLCTDEVQSILPNVLKHTEQKAAHTPLLEVATDLPSLADILLHELGTLRSCTAVHAVVEGEPPPSHPDA